MKKDNGFLINNRDYLFKPNRPGAYYYLIDGDFSFVQIRNNSDLPIKILKGRLNILKEFIEQKYYHADFNTQGLAILYSIKSSADLSRPSTDPNDDV